MKFSQVSISLIHRNLKKINFKLEKISSWFQTGKKSSSSNLVFQTGELEKSSEDRERNLIGLDSRNNLSPNYIFIDSAAPGMVVHGGSRNASDMSRFKLMSQ